MKRYPAAIMCTCVVPWDEQGQFAESLFVHEVETMLKVTPHLYVFGTAGEGHAVTTAQFEQIVRAFHGAMKAGGAEAMVGVINNSLPTMQERIDWCRKLGVKKFQISLPNWGQLTDAEVATFFREICGKFRDCQFLHYNLMRAKRLVTPEQYAELAKEHPNFVATKNSTDSMSRLRGLQTIASELQHFPDEHGYIYASQLGESGLLASLAMNGTTCKKYFQAGQQRDIKTMLSMYEEMSKVVTALIAAAGPNCHIDSAYDKMLWKLSDERFPLRLLPPYQGSTDEGFAQFREAVRTQAPNWWPEGKKA